MLLFIPCISININFSNRGRLYSILLHYFLQIEALHKIRVANVKSMH